MIPGQAADDRSQWADVQQKNREGEAAKRGAAAVTIAQTTNITVNGAGPETAQEIAGLQKDVNQQIVRNTRGAVR